MAWSASATPVVVFVPPPFASHYGADFYGLPRNENQITLVKQDKSIPETYPFGDDELVPFRAGDTCSWQLKN